MSAIGIALPSSCFLNEEVLLNTLDQVQRARVTLLQTHLVSLLSAPTTQLFLDSLQRRGIQLIIHLEDVDDIFSLPRKLKECSAWRYSVVHMPASSIAADALQWCADRLAARQVLLLVENDDDPAEANRFVPTLCAVAGLGLCFDVGHDALACTGIADDDILLQRVQLVHLHGVDVRNRKSHLEPWTRGVVSDAVLARIVTSTPRVPVILEIRDLDMETMAQVVESARHRLVACGWNFRAS